MYRLRLALDDESSAAFDFLAGQYVRVLHPGGTVIPFSIASAPERLPEIEIHFRPTPGNSEAEAMLDLLAHATTFDLEGPLGDVTVCGPTPGSLRLVAGGTGIGQCLAIVEHLARVDQRERVRLLWSVSKREQLYGLDELDELKQRHSWFDYEAVVDTADGSSGALLALRRDGAWGEVDIVLSGSPGFVYAVCDAIEATRGDHGRLRSDVFSYAPR